MNKCTLFSTPGAVATRQYTFIFPANREEEEKNPMILFQGRPYTNARHHTKRSVLGSMVIEGI